MAVHLSPRADRTDGHWLTRAAQMADQAWSRPPRIATCTPGTDAGSIRAARDFTIVTMQRWGVTERSEDVAVVVSELLTNAMQHAAPPGAGSRPRWPIRLGLLQPGSCVLCAVADPSDVVPQPRTPDSLAETGRGLHIICALSDKWGYTAPSRSGKVVWAMFAMAPPA
jgi:hypothetical protein